MKSHEPSPYGNHEEVWALLPWYVNGSLQKEQFEEVRAHIRICLTCRKELLAQKALAGAIKHESSLDIAVKPSFDRLMSRIQDDGKPRKTCTGQREQLRARWYRRLSGAFDIFTHQRPALAFLIGLLVLVSTFFWQPIRLSEPRVYHTVANPGSLDGYTRRDVRVVFAPSASKEEIDGVLQSIHAKILEGPSSIGLYTIRLEGEGVGDSQSATLEKLRANKSVAFAEPALPQAAR